MREARFSEQGAILLEVVLALVLFVGASAVISSAFNASMQSLQRLRLQTHASNFGATILAELQLGIRPFETAGPEQFPPPQDGWSWEIVVASANDQFATTSRLKMVEVILRHADSGFVHRVAQLIDPPEPIDETELFLTHVPPRLSHHLPLSR